MLTITSVGALNTNNQEEREYTIKALSAKLQLECEVVHEYEQAGLYSLTHKHYDIINKLTNEIMNLKYKEAI